MRPDLPFLLLSLLVPACVAVEPLNEAVLPAGTMGWDGLDYALGVGRFAADKNTLGKPLTIRGVVYPHGLGTQADSFLHLDLKRAATRFLADFAVDDLGYQGGKVRGLVVVDGRLVYDSGDPTLNQGGTKPPYRVSVDLTGASDLILGVLSENPYRGQADWGGARLVLDPAATATPTVAALPDPLGEASGDPANLWWISKVSPSLISSGDGGSPGKGKLPKGDPILLRGRLVTNGYAAVPRSRLTVDLRGATTRLLAEVGVRDGSTGQASFIVLRDHTVAYDSGPLGAADAPKRIDVDTTGASTLTLLVTGDAPETGSKPGTWAVWSGPRLVMKPGVSKPDGLPRAMRPEEVAMPIATIVDGPEPAIHGPRIAGSSPGRPFLFAIPATGEAPLSFTATGLPDGLQLDATTGRISGIMAAPLVQVATVTVTNPRGRATRPLTIQCAPWGMVPTPPLGWNSWHAIGVDITDAKIRATADAMVAKGFAAHGFSYVNIDDFWSGKRQADGSLPGDPVRFPDMKALGAYIHGKGLKYGIYASPGESTCGKYLGSLGHEQQDADDWASWGIDYLKYDGCSGGSPERWTLMRKCLDHTGRDIVYSTNTCRDPSAHAQLWRITEDIRNNWSLMANFGFVRSKGTEKYAGPGRYNDPDMLVVGSPDNLSKELALSRNESITHITQWSMLAAPLLLGCDLAKADDFLVSLMCNDDVLAVDQDPLVRQATLLRRDQPQGFNDCGGEVWTRPLFDGTVAVALYNRGAEPVTVGVTWKELALSGPQPVRNCWLRQGLGTQAEGFSTTVEVHGAVLLVIGTPRTDRYEPR